ncbi:hypothetical protein [Plebeiibacterium sediminum]|uniref:Uncharacterized protein n=1 Tax=Plebeiibacterium sediminum TaxID=2992112 RepID=A0AAE3SEJ4_9BACT|nr:hypothetical protein [Plebeiobacterium sediminum]MCW3786435.1 hypothetical protein [Plebeiobacterium sediminum]
MIATLHNITDSIVIRKSLKWRNCILNDDNKTECNTIFENMQLMLLKFLRKLSKNSSKTDLVSHCIRNVYSIKSRLQEKEWPLPCSLSKNENEVYLHDFNFYLMLCGILTKASTLFKGYLSAKDRLSFAQTLPVVQGNSRRIIQTINLLPQTTWIQIIKLEQEKNKFLQSLDMLDHKISELDPSSAAYSFLSNYHMSITSSPDNLEQEKHIIKCHQNILQIVDDYKHLDSYNMTSELMHEGFKLGWTHKKTKEKIYDYFMNDYLNKAFIVSEIKKLRYTQKKCKKLISKGVIKNERVMNFMNEIILKLSQLSKKDTVVHDYIEWTHSPKEFVKAIHKFITEGYINFKGNTDLQPIVEHLTRFIKVRKMNNSGMLTQSSLLSYFKKANSGDLI